MRRRARRAELESSGLQTGGVLSLFLRPTLQLLGVPSGPPACDCAHLQLPSFVFVPVVALGAEPGGRRFGKALGSLNGKNSAILNDHRSAQKRRSRYVSRRWSLAEPGLVKVGRIKPAGVNCNCGRCICGRWRVCARVRATCACE